MPPVLSVERCLPVLGELENLFPNGGLQRGSVVELGGAPGVTTLALALIAGAVRTGSWMAAIGFDEVGWEAAEGLGVPLENVVVVRIPANGNPHKAWQKALTQLTASFDLVLCGPRISPAAAQVRQIRSRARERGSVVLGICRETGAAGLSGTTRGWPGSDIRVVVKESDWEGLGSGWGALGGRQLRVLVEGRGSMSRPREFLVGFDSDGGLSSVRPMVAPAGRPAVGRSSVGRSSVGKAGIEDVGVGKVVPLRRVG
jgi:hypothetical protein